MVTIDLESCTGCGLCEKDCSFHNIIMKDAKAQVVSDTCSFCGHCVAICPDNAVTIPELDMADVTALSAEQPSPAELLSLIKTRRSIRQYQNKPLEPELIRQIIEAGRYTPTASNRQELSFIVIEKEMQAFRALIVGNLAELGRAALASADTPPRQLNYAQRWVEIEKAYREDPRRVDSLFFNVPVVILVAGDNPIDAGLAASNMELVACTQGLGVLYSGFITRGSACANVREAVGIPPDKEVLATLLVGYPQVKYQRSAPRKKADIIWR